MGNWYRVTKTIHGHKYDYWQKTYRVGRTTKTLNKYIGPSRAARLAQIIVNNRAENLRIRKHTTGAGTIVYHLEGDVPKTRESQWARSIPAVMEFGDRQAANVVLKTTKRLDPPKPTAQPDAFQQYAAYKRATGEWTTEDYKKHTAATLPKNYHALTTDEKKALLKPLGRFPVDMQNEPTGTTVLIRSTDLPNNYVVEKIKEATLPDGTTYRYVNIYPYPENCTLCGRPNSDRAKTSACQSCRDDIPW